MEDVLAKVRAHGQSGLASQRTQANVLAAVDGALEQQRTDQSPTAYYAALLTTLSATIERGDLTLDEASILPAVLYLLSRVAPFVPVPVVRTNLTLVLDLTAPLFPSIQQDAPALRSQLSLYHAVFLALDRTQLDVHAVRQSFASILELCVDRRPKVRKLAADTIKDVLAHPPAPLVCHPYASKVAEWVKTILSETAAGPISKGKAKQNLTPGAEVAIHLLAFLRTTIHSLPPSAVPQITSLLLSLPRLGNTYLSQSAYSILSDIFTAPLEEDTTNLTAELPHVLKVILTALPPKSDHALSSTWVLVLSHALVALNASVPKAASAEVYKVWKGLWNFLDSPEASLRKNVAVGLSGITVCFSEEMVSGALSELKSTAPEKTNPINRILAQLSHSLTSLAYARSIPELLTISAAVLTNLRYRMNGPSSPTATELLGMGLVRQIAEMRVEKGFEFKEAADAFLGAVMRVVGPEVLLGVLELNLEPEKRANGAEPRAFLLPLLAQPHPSALSHFLNYFVPLSETIFNCQQKAESEGRASEAKVWSVLVSQIWAGLPAYCAGTRDLEKSLTPTFAQLLSQLLYSQVELRPFILKALKTMVEYNTTRASSPPEAQPQNKMAMYDDLTPAEAQVNIDYLKSQAESWLAVLFNVYGSAAKESRGALGEVVQVWLGIAGDTERHNAFTKCFDLFQTNLRSSLKSSAASTSSSTSRPSTSQVQHENDLLTVSQDIILLLVPTLSVADAKALFEVYFAKEVLSKLKDNAVQKRAYKILGRILEHHCPTSSSPSSTSNPLGINPTEILTTLSSASITSSLAPSSKKDRFVMLSHLVEMLGEGDLHVVALMVTEGVLGTKEPSEKTRGAAFEFLVGMGRKMGKGGVVKRGLVVGDEDEEMEDDGEAKKDATASVEEYMTMIAGGLAGASPHMISATVTAISRLVFEFKDVISEKMHNEILTTLFIFLTSNNREIVKSTLGFIKLAIHTLPTSLIRPHLPELVPALLGWSKDHKNHFKVKVRHIFERMLRRFAWEEIYGPVESMEDSKVLVNVKKRKERAKRRKANREEEGDEEDAQPKRPTAGDAFEDVLYGSESEDGDDDSDGFDDDDERPQTQKGSKNQKDNLRLRLDGDEPLDLLQGAGLKLTHHAKANRRKPGADASRFKTDEETGKMIIDGDSDSDSPTNNPALATQAAVEGDAYRESLVSVDGFTRGPNGRVKFHKDTKKRRREELEAEIGDVEMADATPAQEGQGGGQKKKKKKQEVRLGHEFKAKKAGGDVKKGGVDPFAYLTLSQAAKAKGKGKIGIARR